MTPEPHLELAEVVYDGGLQNGWQDWGWAPHELQPGGPAAVHFDEYGGWTLAKPSRTGEVGGVVFNVREPVGEGEFLEVYLLSQSSETLPKIKVGPDDRTEIGGGWAQVFLPMSRLDPNAVPFDRIVLHAFRPLQAPAVLVDKIALTKAGPRAPSASALDAGNLPTVTMHVDCRARSTPISPLIYGIAMDDSKQQAQWATGATVRRWGGNLSTTYNWEIGAWNTGNDWYFENHDAPSYAKFFDDNANHGVVAALTVPISGWVAKDKTSVSFPVGTFGPQDATDPWRAEAGNGKRKGGGLVAPGPPDRAYVAVDPDFVKRWVEAIRAEDTRRGKRSVAMYILDNEPMLWNATHRDLHPDPLSYDELLRRTIEYATAIRNADPGAVIAGPAEWGWTNYLYSAKDMANGGPALRPDRRAHGDVPLIAYYLKTLAEHDRATGVRLLDVLDLHGYPYADKVSGEGADAQTAALRIRTTRMLWDPTYVDESWVKEPVNLLPRMHEWVDKNYPGTGLSIGEWNFGGERQMSGALAIAEALGRYAQFGLASAYYWTCPPENTPGLWAFRAYRNYDGRGSHFLDWYTASSVTGTHDQSLFASRDASGTHMVVTVLNFAPNDDVAASIDVSSCGKVDSMTSYTYDGGPSGFASHPTVVPTTPVPVVLPRYSITVLEMRFAAATALVK